MRFLLVSEDLVVFRSFFPVEQLFHFGSAPFSPAVPLANACNCRDFFKGFCPGLKSVKQSNKLYPLANAAWLEAGHYFFVRLHQNGCGVGYRC